MTGEPFPEDRLLALLARWSAEQRHREAVGARVRERRLRQLQAESATVRGFLVDLAEERRPATLTVGGRPLSGRIVGVGTEFCVVKPSAGGPTLVSIAAVTAISQPAGDPGDGGGHRRPGPAGDRLPVIALSLAAALADLATELSPVCIWSAPERVTTGDLVAVGEDVATMRLDRRAYLHLPLEAVQACIIL